MSKISELSDGGSLQSTDYLIAVRSGGNVKVRPNGAVSGTTGQFSTSLNVDGTVTADGLTVDGDVVIDDNDATPLVVKRSGGTDANTSVQFEQLTYNTYLGTDASGGFTIGRAADLGTQQALKAAQNGDISFYEDTGTTPKFFWDASAESLGIGTTSPDADLHVSNAAGSVLRIDTQGGTNADSVLNFRENGVDRASLYWDGADNDLYLETTAGDIALMPSGNVGIGTTSPSTTLVVSQPSDNTDVAIFHAGGGTTNRGLKISTFSSVNSNAGVLLDAQTTIGGAALAFATGGTERMRIDSSGNVGIGTSSPATKLHVDTGAAGYGLTLAANTQTSLTYQMGIDSSSNFAIYDSFAASQRLVINTSGNVGVGNSSPSNYTGASANNLVVGSNSGNNGITIVGGTDGYASLAFADSAGAGDTTDYRGLLQYYHNTDTLNIFTAGAERARIDSSGNLLVGTTNTAPSVNNVAGLALLSSGQLQTTADGASAASFNRKTSDGSVINLRKDGTTVGSIASVGGSDIKVVFSSDGDQYITGNAASNYLSFSSANAERMRLDSSGNLLVGKTSTSGGIVGSVIASSGLVRLTADGIAVAEINRLTSDGSIVDFKKNGTTVGSIGVVGGSIIFGRGDTALAVNDGLDALYPIQADGTPRDAAIDLGRSGTSGRFKDLYLSGGVYLGGTGAANLLEDYETGTFTASTLTGETSGSVTIQSTLDTLAYTKVGRLVTITGRLRVSSASSPVGDYVTLTLPFTSSQLVEEAGYAGGCSIYSDDGSATWNAMPCRVQENTTTMELYLPLASIDSDYRLEFNFSYLTG